MGEEFKDFEMEGPSLTLEPDLGEFEKKEEPVKVEQPQPKEEAPALTPAEQQMVNEFAAKIDIENTNQILQYGAGTQKKMEDFSDTALENVKMQDLGEIGDLITNVVGELRDFDAHYIIQCLNQICICFLKCLKVNNPSFRFLRYLNRCRMKHLCVFPEKFICNICHLSLRLCRFCRMSDSKCKHHLALP